MIEGTTYGAEAWATWQVTPRWRLSAGSTALQKDLQLKPGSTDPDGPRNLGNDPSAQWTLNSAFNLPSGHEIDLGLRRVGALPDPAVPAYTAVDLRCAWRIGAAVEVALVGRNLLDRAHPEFNSTLTGSEVSRSLSLQLRWAL